MHSRTALSILSVLSLAGCAQPSANTIHDQAGREVTIVDTGVDQAGGPRLVTIGQFDAERRYHVLAAAHGPGSAQTLLPAVIGAVGFVGGMAALRPPQVSDTTTVSNATTQSGGSSSVSPGAIVANGGAGGAGGLGGAGGVGGAGGSSAGGSATAATAPVSATGGSATATGGTATSAAINSASSVAAATSSATSSDSAGDPIRR